MAMIPQDPVLFSGTIRSNIDPFGIYCTNGNDSALWDALQKVQLRDYVEGLPRGLDTTVLSTTKSASFR